MKARSFLQKMSKFGGYVSKLSIKSLVRKMMETKLTIGKKKAFGFMIKERKPRLSTRARGDGQN